MRIVVDTNVIILEPVTKRSHVLETSCKGSADLCCRSAAFRPPALAGSLKKSIRKGKDEDDEHSNIEQEG
jgi:hypothetical protein